MHLGIRILLGFFLITGLAGVFVLRIFVAEVKPSVREVMEDMMVDTANLLAELAADDLRAGAMPSGHFATQVAAYARRPVDARIWGLDKQSLDIRVYVTDVRGKVVFDSAQQAVGQDFSQWRDVARTLREQRLQRRRSAAAGGIELIDGAGVKSAHGTKLCGIAFDDGRNGRKPAFTVRPGRLIVGS